MNTTEYTYYKKLASKLKRTEAFVAWLSLVMGGQLEGTQMEILSEAVVVLQKLSVDVERSKKNIKQRTAD